MTDERRDTSRTVDLAHEALITGWPTLQGWVAERREIEQARRRLEEKVREWHRLGRGQGGLLDAAELAEAERWLASPDAVELGYGEDVLALLQASRAHLTADLEWVRAQTQRLRRRLQWVAALAVLALVAALVVGYFFNQATDESARAQQNEDLALQRADEAAAAAGTAEAEADARATAEAAAKGSADEAATQAAQAQAAAATAEVESTRAAQSEATALAAADARATAQVVAETNATAAASAQADALLSADEAERQAAVAATEAARAEAERLNAEAESTRAAQSAATAQAQEATAEANANAAATAQAAALANAATAEAAQATAEHEAQLARSQQFAAQANNYAATQLDLALLLSLEAVAASDTAEARGSLLDTLRAQPHLRTMLHGHEEVNSVDFSPDGTMLASANTDGTVILWDVERRTPLGDPLTGHADSVWEVAFSPDGTMLASASADNTVILWDVATQEPLGDPLTAHDDVVWSVAFGPDGTLLASGGADNTVILWDVEQRTPLGDPLTGHDDAVFSVVFSPGGTMLASGSWDETVILWDVGFESWKTQACVRANRNLSANEWLRFFGETEPYHLTCPNLPPGEGVNDDLTFVTPAPEPADRVPDAAPEDFRLPSSTPVATPEAQAGRRVRRPVARNRHTRAANHRVSPDRPPQEHVSALGHRVHYPNKAGLAARRHDASSRNLLMRMETDRRTGVLPTLGSAQDAASDQSGTLGPTRQPPDRRSCG